MPLYKLHRLFRHPILLMPGILATVFSSPSVALDLGVRCQANPDSVFQVVREAALAMPQWRSIRVVEGQRAVKAIVLNLKNYGVPVVIQVQSNSEDGTNRTSEVHMFWEQTMDPVNYPDVLLFMDSFWERQKALGLNCINTGTDVGL